MLTLLRKFGKMADSKVELANQLKQKINMLISRYEELKSQNLLLVTENERLNSELSEMKSEYAQLDDKFSTYKLSQSFVDKSGNATDTKKRINQIVREIDKCIALLNR